MPLASGAGIAYLSGVPDLIPPFCGVLCFLCSVLLVIVRPFVLVFGYCIVLIGFTESSNLSYTCICIIFYIYNNCSFFQTTGSYFFLLVDD